MRHFSPETDPKLFACPCGKCDAKPTKRLLASLDSVRDVVGFPLGVSSGPRCKAYNKKIGGAKYSEHMDGDGADIPCTSSSNRIRIVDAALNVGINRIGIAKTYIHLGVSETNDQMVMWVY